MRKERTLQSPSHPLAHMPVIYEVLSVCVNHWGSSAGLYALSTWQFRTSEADGTYALLVALYLLYSFSQKTCADHIALSPECQN